jgi:hypothetical protein
MKKFNDGDIFYNSIKAYPKVKFTVHAGVISYNNTDTDGNAVLFDFLRIPVAGEGAPIGAIMTETEVFILSEDSEYIITE